MDARIEQVTTSGKCTVDDTEYDVESNTYIVGDDDEVIVIDPAHDAEAILKAVDGREVRAVICTDGNDAHLNVVLEVAVAQEKAEEDAEEDEPAEDVPAAKKGKFSKKNKKDKSSKEDEVGDTAPIAVHRHDRLLWRDYFGRLARDEENKDDAKALKALEPDIYLEDGGIFEIADVQLEVHHTPGHTPGSISLYCEQLGVLFTGDTLHRGRPGSIGGVFSDLRQQLNSIGSLITPLPKDTRVLPGQGEETTVGDEDARWESWGALARESEDD